MRVEVIPPAFSWESQAAQYDPTGDPGLGFEQHMVSLATGEEVFDVPPELAGPDVSVIDCLLHRDAHGRLNGILNHYDGKNPLEHLHAVNVWVRPDHRRRGLATLLIEEAMTRWPGVTLDNQRYTPDGVRWLQEYLKSKSAKRMTENL